MRIAGMLPTSLQDYPGQISAVFFMQGCNFRCPYCHNPELIEKSCPKEAEVNNTDFYEENEIFSLLRERRDYLDGVVITGGEPTLQSNLCAFLQKVKGFGFKIKIDTNGSRPKVLHELLSENTLDMVAWDYKLPVRRYHELTVDADIAEKINLTGRLLASADLEVEIRTTMVPRLMKKEDLIKICQELSGYREESEERGNNCRFPDHYVLQEFRPRQVLDSAFSSITPFPRKKMEEFSRLAEKYFDSVEVRGNV